MYREIEKNDDDDNRFILSACMGFIGTKIQQKKVNQI